MAGIRLHVFLRWNIATSFICLLACRPVEAAAPFFDPQNPTDFFSATEKFSVEIKVADPDPSSTAAGQILNATLISYHARSALYFPFGDNAFDGVLQYSISLNPPQSNRSNILLSLEFNRTSRMDIVPMPHWYVCLQVLDGSQSQAQSCFKFHVPVKPRIAQNCKLQGNGLFQRNPMSDTRCALNALQSSSKIGVGQSFEAFAYFEDLTSDGTETCALCDRLTITVRSDPGLPNNLLLGPSYGGPESTHWPSTRSNLVGVYYGVGAIQESYQYLYSRRILFKPDIEQVGLKYDLCLNATEHHSSALGSFPAASAEQCFTLEVVRPDLKLFEQPRSDLNLNPAAPINITVHSRCRYSWKFAMSDKNDLNFRLTEPEAGYQRGHYTPNLSVDQLEMTLPGSSLARKEKVLLCSDFSSVNCPVKDKFNLTIQYLDWTVPGGLEARDFGVCFDMSDEVYMLGKQLVGCINFHVEKCKTCVSPVDSLYSLAIDYQTDWLQLWGANSMIRDPMHITETQVLNLGPLLEVYTPHSVDVVIKRFRMNETSFRRLNPDIAGSVVLPGMQICLAPLVCLQGV
uniref:LysM domain-containing protein n=1 Tax=Hanusia phi TaxID=3032 RepID=A0A7S0E3F6_9CRYP|mmetsp:Transcript_15995/g.36530  ORF Transcript_15995/g.36530 Transcript_15995/m.36530 type:complete len:572 (+) Transcript_15995:211-1926(+)